MGKKEKEEKKKMPESIVELYYKRVMRVIEYYIFLCFIIITIFPLLEYSWIPAFIKFIYFTGFPLFILLLIVTFVKDSLIESLKNRFEPEKSDLKTRETKK